MNGEFSIHIGAEVPEKVGIEFKTTGLIGGNYSHGGVSTISFIVDSGCFSLDTSGEREHLFDRETFDPMKISFNAFGDWEQTGLEDALIELGKHLSALKESRKKI